MYVESAFALTPASIISDGERVPALVQRDRLESGSLDIGVAIRLSQLIELEPVSLGQLSGSLLPRVAPGDFGPPDDGGVIERPRLRAAEDKALAST
jgi:hypothetical protein